MPTAPPSPTAVTINLLNLLKIANTMSHPLYNPFASGDQSSTKRQCELSSISAERDPRRAASHLGPGSSFSSSGASSSIPANSRGVLPSLMSQSTSYKPEQSRAIMDEDIERSIDMHISRAREGVRLLSNPIYQPVDQGTCFTTTQRNEIHSSGTGLASFPVSSTSASQECRHLDEESGSSSVDWASSYRRTSPDDSNFYSPSFSSNCASGGDGRFNAPSKRDHEMQSIPGLGNYDSTVPDRPTSSTESRRPKYTFESAANILQQFGLEKEDLEQLISYPEDQITPAKLPFILREIRLQKAKRATPEIQPNPYPELQPNRNQGGRDSHNLSTSGGAGMRQEAMSSAVLQPSKVIDYGHSAKYTGGTGDEIGRTGGSRADSGGSRNMLLMDTHDGSRHSQELLQKNTTEVKSSAFGSSREQASSVTGLSSSYSSVLNSVAPPSHNQTKQLHTRPNQTLQTICSSFSLPQKDTDFRVLKSEASKPAPSKEPEADRQSTLKTQPLCSVFHGVHPSRSGLVVIGSNDGSGTRDDSKTQGQGSAVAEQMKKQQLQQSQQMQKMAVSQTGQAWPSAFSAAKSFPPAPFIPTVADASGTMQQPVFFPGDPRPIVIPPALPQPIPALMTFNHMTLPTSNRQPPATMSVSKGLPTAAMMHDYAASSPKIFPHTCSLCKKECTHMKDWLSHQNTSLHLQSCQLLRARYPEWDGEIALRPSVAGKDAKPSASTSAQTSQHHHQKTRHGSYSSSRSDSPGRRRSSEGRREKHSSRSRSPHSSRYSHRSRSRSRSPWYDHPTSCHYRSRSGSPERRLSPRRRDERRSPPRRREERRSPPRRGDETRSPPRRSDERRSPPRRGDERRSPPRRVDERRSPPRRGDERRSPPRRSDERRSPPRRSDERRSPPRRVEERRSPPRRINERRLPQQRVDERRSPPRRVDERRSSPRRSDKRRSPPRRSHESRLSSEGSSLPRKSSNAEKLAKKLLQSSVIQSLSKQSDLDAVVKTLAPALLAELAKMKSSSSKPSSSSPSAEAKRLSATVSSSSSSCRAKKESTTKLSEVKPILQKSIASSSTTEKSGKTSPPTMVRLEGIQRSLSHNDVTAAVEHFGKTKSVVLFRTKQQAIVCFEKEEDAQKLKSMKTLTVKGTEIRVVGGKETVSKEQKKPPEKKPDTSSVSKPQNTPKSKTTTTTRKVLHPTPNMPPLKESLLSAAKKAPTGKLTNQKVVAKSSVKGPTTVVKSKVLVSKAKNISTKQVAKTVKTGKLSVTGTVKKVVVKQKASSGSKSAADDSEQKAVPEKTSVKESVVVLKETAEGDETEEVAASEAQHQAKPAEDAEPMELGEAGREVAEPMEDGSCAEGEGKKSTTTEAVPENSADKSNETRPPASTVETRSTEASTKASPQVQQSTLSEPESTAPGSKSTAPENQPESVVVLKETAEGYESSERTVTEPAEGREIATEAKVLVSKPEMVSSMQEPQTPVDKLAAEGAVDKEKVEQPPAKATIVPDVETSSPEESETNVQEGVVVLKETAEVVETPNVTTFVAQQQAKLAEDTEPMELGEAGGEVAEPVEDGSCAEGEGKKPTTTEAVPENSADKSNETRPPASTVETGSTKASTKASSQVQQSTLSEPESTAPGSESTAPENKPESVVVLKETAEGDESSERTVTEPAEGREIVTEAKVLVSKPEMVSSTQEPQTPVDKLAAEGAVDKEKVEQPPAKATIVPDVATSSPEESQTKVQEGVVVLKETAEVVETPNVTTFVAQQQAKLAEDTEPMELGEAGREVAEPMEDGSCAEGEGKKPTTTEAVPENSADKSNETRPPASTVETGSTEASTKASPQVQQSTLSEPESTAPGSESTAPENKPESVVVLKETAEGYESSERTVTEPAEGREIVTEAKVLVSKPEMVSSTQEPQTPVDKLAAEGAVDKEKVEQPPAKATIVPDVATSSPEESQTKVQEGVVVLKEPAEVVETPNVTTFVAQQQAKLAEDAEPMELGEAGGEVAEPMEDGSCAEGEGKKSTTTEAVPENSADKPNETRPPASTVETESTEASTKASPQVQQSTLSEPESTAPGPETKMEASQMQQQAAVEAKVETRTMQDEDAEGAVKTQTDAVSAKDSSVTTKPTAAVVSKQQPAASTPSPTAGTPLTVGEMVEKHLHQGRISCLSINFCLTPKLFQLGKKLLLITGLPKYHDGCYTEDDVVQLLTPFGFEHTDENIYVVPQTCMAFVMMPSVGNVQKIIEVGKKTGIFFKGSKLLFSVVDNGIEMTPLGFYQSLIKRMNFPVLDDGLRTVFIRNISPSEIRDLREALRKISFVKNFLPLLNKVFIEFAFIRDADRLGVWYSLLKKAPACNVHRLKIPIGSSLSPLPKLPENALPDSQDVVAGATIPTVEFGVPQGSISPFWVTMRTRPFLFPTISPWFIIPNYLTVKVKGDIEKAGLRGSAFSTIMLTGLPGGNYEHEDVAKLVQPYFPKWNSHSMYYSLVVLPLQRRAFVFFADWTSCCDFVRDHMKDRFSVRGSRLCVHFVLQDMNPGSSEEMMYKSLMKWSNAGVPESESLEERLLCVEISETSVDIVGVVMEAVASIATVVGFLPLANRICVEMADSSGVKQVVEKCKAFCQSSEKHALWTKVMHLETLKSLKLRLQGEITTEPNAQPPPSELLDNGSQPGLQTSDPGGSTMSEPVTAGQSAAASSSVSMEVDGEKSGTGIVVDSTVGPEPNKDVDGSLTTSVSTADLNSASAVSSRNTVPAASSPAPSATALMRKENYAEVLPIDPEIFKVLTAAVRQHRLSRANRSHSEKESPSKNNTSSRTVTSEDTPQRMGQDDCKDDVVSSDTCLFDGQNFSMEDFVTVDEVGEDVKDTSLKPYSSSSSSSRVRRERQSSGVSSGSKQTSTRSSRDSKSAASSSLSSSKSTKGSSSSSSSSVSPKKSRDSSEPTKLPTKPSSSAKPSSSSSPPSIETVSLPGQKTQQSKKKSPSKASSTTSSARSTLSSSTKREREKITSAAAVEASTESHLESLREEAKATESAVAKSDHKVSAEGNAVKTPQSKTKMGTEKYPPPQGHGEELSQGQSQEIDFNINTLKDQKKSKEEGKEEDVDKQTEEDDVENYQILDSFDDQTDEQMEGSSETQQTGPEEGQTLHEESYQDIDGEDNKGNAHPEEDSEMEMDGSVQVLDSVAENQEASSQEDNHTVQDDSSTAKQVSEEDATPVDDKSDAKLGVEDAVDKDQETNNKDNFQVLDTGSTQAPRVKGDGKKKNQKEEEVKGKILSVESCKASKDVEDPDIRIPDEDQPHQNRDYKDDLKDLDSDINEPDQEMFEILDSIDDPTAKEDDSQKFETPSDQTSKEHIRPREEEEHVYQVIDSLEDQPTTTSQTDSKDKRAKKGETPARRDDGPSKRSRATTTASKVEEKEKSPKKEDRMVKRYETRKKMDTTTGVFKKDRDTEEATEEMVYKVVDSVGDELVQDGTTRERTGRRRSARGKKEDKIPLTLTETSQKPVVDEEAVYEILDSVEGETVDDVPTVPTKSTRGRRERTSKKDALIEETKKENTSTRRRPTPARESQEGNRERTPKKEEKAPSKHSTPTKKSDIVVKEEVATNEMFDSVEDKVVKDDRPTPARKRGRPKKEVKTTKKDTGTLKKGEKEASETVADEEEVTYQILDSVEDEPVDDQPPTGQSESSRRENVSKNDGKQTENIVSLSGSTENEEEEEEPMYQIVDSLEDDQDDLTSTEVSDRGRKDKQNETPTTEEALAGKGGTPTHGTTAVEDFEKMIVQEESLYQIVDDLDEVPDDPSAAEESGRRNKEGTSQTDTEKEDKSATKSQRRTVTTEEEKKQKSPEKNDPTSALVKLDEVSEEEEEDYPDNPADEEELRKRQASTKKKQFPKEQEARRTREGEWRNQRSRSSSRGHREGMRKAKERGRENEEKVEVDTSELVTLDEVGADEAREEGAQESRDWDEEITEGELQTLVTLDEFIEEEEEDGKAEGGAQETRPLSQEDESVDSLNPETLVTLDEAACDEEEKPDEEQAEKTSSSAKRKHDDDTEESMNFVTVDEVGEEEEEEKEVVTTRTRGQARKRARPTPVRRSTRGKKVSTKDETEEEKEPADVLPPSSLDASSSLDKDPSTLSSDGQAEIQKTEVEAVSRADVDAASAGQELPPERPENQTLERCVEEGEEEKEAWSRMDVKAVSQRRRELVGPEAKRSRSQSPRVAADFTLPPFKPNTPLGHCSNQRPNDNLQPSKSVKRRQRRKQQNTRRNGSSTTPEVLQGEEKTGGMQPARPPTIVGKGKAGSFNAEETVMDNMGLTPDQKSVFKPDHNDELEPEVTWSHKDSDLESSQDLQSPPPERGRIQLFDDRGERLQDGELADPNNWSKIAIVRPGRMPTHSPFKHMSFRQATEIKSQSRMVSCFAVETPAKPGDCSDVRATLYDHCQGPWAEIEELVQGKMPQLVAYLVAQPAQAVISPRKGYYYNHLTTKSINKTAKNVQEKVLKGAKE